MVGVVSMEDKMREVRSICDAGALAKEAQGNLGDQQAKDNHDQGAIQALFLIHKLPGVHCFGGPFRRIKLGDDWASPTLLDSLTCLLSHGEEYFGLRIKYFAGEGHLSTYPRFGSRKSDFLFCLVSFSPT